MAELKTCETETETETETGTTTWEIDEESVPLIGKETD